LEHASKKPSADVAKQAIRNAVEIWGNPMVSELLPAKQMEFIRALREGYDGQEPLSDHTILSRLSRIWAAMNYCKAEGIIQFVPTMVRRERWEPHLPSGGRELSIAELGRLFHEAGRRDTPTSREHLWRFMVLAVGTAHRRSALQELRKDQVDLENGIIQLNPEGRRQTKKRRPTLPMSQILRAHIKEWDASPSGHYVTYNGRPLTSDTWFDNLREAAKVDCSANDIRHTVITWMVKQKVDPVQRRIFEGHKAPSESGAEDSYIHLDPNYLIEPRRAVDKLFKAIAPHVKSRQLVKRQAS
jgi:integrase